MLCCNPRCPDPTRAGKIPKVGTLCPNRLCAHKVCEKCGDGSYEAFNCKKDVKGNVENTIARDAGLVPDRLRFPLPWLKKWGKGGGEEAEGSKENGTKS